MSCSIVTTLAEWRLLLLATVLATAGYRDVLPGEEFVAGRTKWTASPRRAGARA